MIKRKPLKHYVPFFKTQNIKNYENYRTQFSINSFNSLISLTNSEVTSLKTTFSRQLISAKT